MKSCTPLIIFKLFTLAFAGCCNHPSDISSMPKIDSISRQVARATNRAYVEALVKRVEDDFTASRRGYPYYMFSGNTALIVLPTSADELIDLGAGALPTLETLN